MDCLYVKVLLYAYPRLREVSEAVSAGVENKAALSFRSTLSALDTAERIAEEIFLRKNLDCVTDAIERALSMLSEEEMFCLEYKYFRRKRILGVRFAGYSPLGSERSYYRKQAELLKKICFRLAAAGWTETRFFEAFGEFPYFMKVYRALQAGRESAVTVKRGRRGFSFQTSVPPSEGGRGGFLPRSTKNATATASAQKMQITAICTPVSPPSAEVGLSPSASPPVGVR